MVETGESGSRVKGAGGKNVKAELKKVIEQNENRDKMRMNNPPAGGTEGWAGLARNLRAEIDGELIEAYRGMMSLAFEAGEHKRAAVEIVDERGSQRLKIVELE